MVRTRQRDGAAPQRKIRYAVVGLGYIAQIAVLPAFAHAENAELAALVSDDPVKLTELGERYQVAHRYSYAEYDDCLRSGEVDAVYVALPNNLHCEYTVRAAKAGVHVLCEKPMAVTVQECESMIDACRENHVRLMIAYRLHFERANLEAIEIARSGQIGEPRIFNATFTLQVVEPNIRLEKHMGGGTLYDVGIYCINAARYLFRDEPVEVYAALAGRNGEVEDTASAILRFPEERVGAFTSSFGAAKVSAYQLIGTKGDLRVDPAFEYADNLRHRLTLDQKIEEHVFPKRDQFGPELVYFSDCILENREPEPSGEEGLADVRVIEALYRSAEAAKPITLPPLARRQRPALHQAIHRPPVKKPPMVHARSPSGAKRN